MTAEEFKWFEIKSQTVTNCCSSFNWSQAENGDIICHTCNNVKKDNVHIATIEDYHKIGLKMSQERIDQTTNKYTDEDLKNGLNDKKFN